MYMLNYRHLFLLVFVLNLISCSSFHKSIQNAPLGMTKKQALKRFSEPQEKYRTKGMDHWVYETSKKAKNRSQGKVVYKHVLIFDEGLLVDTSFKRSFTNKELNEFYEE